LTLGSLNGVLGSPPQRVAGRRAPPRPHYPSALRSATGGRLYNPSIFTAAGQDSVGQMEAAGRHPNPINRVTPPRAMRPLSAGRIGATGPDRIRVRNERGWNESQLFTGAGL
jgi:hypothetical protein